MAALVGNCRSPHRRRGVVVLIFGQTLLSGYAGGVAEGLTNDISSILWKLVYIGFFSAPIELGPDGPRLVVLYTIIPWIGVMAAGYAFGTIVTQPREKRDRLCLTIGLAAIALFVVLPVSTLWRSVSMSRANSARTVNHIFPHGSRS